MTAGRLASAVAPSVGTEQGLGGLIVPLLRIDPEGAEVGCPRSRASSAARSTRARNRPAVARTASSGSAPIRRATLTAANSTSPSSPSSARSAARSASGSGRAASSSASSRSSDSRSRERRPRAVVVEADRGGAPLHLARVQQPRQHLGHVVEDPDPLLLVDLDLLPALPHLARRVGLGIAEDVRVAADQLRA